MAVKTRWDKRTYRRHMFNRGRGVHSPHEVTNTHQGTAEFIDSQLNNGGRWWEATWRSAFAGKLSAAKEYEQYNNPASLRLSPFTFDSDERGKFRKQDREEVRNLFTRALKDHHFVQGRKVTKGRLDKIVDAYMSQDDDKFQKTLRSMGVNDRDAVRFTRAAEEAATKAIEGHGYEDSWSDDPYQNAPVTPSTNGGSESPKGPTNGQRQVKTESAAQDTVSNRNPIVPRTQVPPQTDVTTVGPYSKVAASDTGVRLNGAPVDVGATATKARMNEAQRESATIDALQARRTRQEIQNDMKSDDRRLYQEHLANQDALDANMKARSDRLRAAREAAHKDRMDKRYKSRTLTGTADWENLGRDSTKRDFSKRAKEESDESWNARSGAVDAVNKLRERFDTLGVKDADKNDFYAYNPNRMRDVSGLRNLFDKAVERGNLTDAQIEGLTKTLDMYEGEGHKAKARIKERVALHDAENVRRYRTKYGLMDRNARGEYIISNDEVKDIHERKQKAAQAEILRGMQVAPGQGGAEGRSERLKQFSDSWMKLMDNGFDVEGTLDRALSDPATRKAYVDAKASVGLDDPEAADKLDQIRRRFVMNQAMTDAGLNDKVYSPRIDVAGKPWDRIVEETAAELAGEMTRELPGRSGLRPDPLVGVNPSDNGSGSMLADLASEASKPLKKKEDTQQAAKGGMVLRPRRRT